MNDWYNDPPDDDGYFGDDPQPEDFDTPDLPPDFFAVGKECPHGNPWAECNACMVEGDFAYDAARERGR